MTAVDASAVPPKGRGARLPLILGLVLALMGGAGGFALVRSGLLDPGGAPAGGEAGPAEAGPLPALEPGGFVPLPPLVVNLPGPGQRLLRFAGQLEVSPAHVGEVTAVVPRVVDVLNGYLRAVEPAEVEDPAALLRLRAQMLRRVQVVAGGDRVRDLLVMEFMVN